MSNPSMLSSWRPGMMLSSFLSFPCTEFTGLPSFSLGGTVLLLLLVVVVVVAARPEEDEGFFISSGLAMQDKL
ncbi:hypothetical protein OPV22_010596 [Ensete ventricosum]|uniref:Uncharacterized protein n=1 Tax=Ensete ventricosum TaxID=4639 RepID=A0AAV8RDF7_ENSVE|nr:hypothetical protein OPV22_010596 [Ensete ventricosum]